MTIKEMFKKVEAYNEVAEIIGNNKVEIHFTEGFQTIRAESLKEFRKQITKIYAGFAAEPILKGDYKLYETNTITVEDDFGYVMDMNLEYGIYEK